jgi:hypothetical protein
MRPLKVAICGGGRTGHLNAVLFKQRPGVEVSLLTGNRTLIERRCTGTSNVTAHLPDGGELAAGLDVVSHSPDDALADADIVVITVPAHARPALLRSIATSLPKDKPVYVGAIPGFCGFDWLAEKLLGDRPNIVIWGMKDVPHTAYDLELGKSIRMGGAKSRLHIATHAREGEDARLRLLGHLQALYDAPVDLLDHYLEITLTPGNPIMHSSVLYGLVGPYGQHCGRTFPSPICWWTECPELGAYFLERTDQENQALCRAVERHSNVDLSSVKPLRQEIIEAYGDLIGDQRTMLSVLRTNRAYGSIQAPMVCTAAGQSYIIDVTSRAFQEDIACGLSLLVKMARRLELRLPYIEEIHAWGIRYMGGNGHSANSHLPDDWPR